MPTTKHNLVLDDDPIVAAQIRKLTDISTLAFSSINALMEQVSTLNPICAFIDIHLPENQSGLAVIPLLKTHWPTTPIIVLTADESQAAIEAAMAAGADDFLRKPLEEVEFNARLNARLEQKAQSSNQSEIRFKDLIISPSLLKIVCHKKEAYLSQTALNLLTTLIDLKESTVKRDTLKRKVWGRLSLTDNALDRKVYEVRKTLEDLGSKIEISNVYGEGYHIAGLSKEMKTTKLKAKEVVNEKETKSNATASSINVLLIEDNAADAILIWEALKTPVRNSIFKLKRVETLSEGCDCLKKGGVDVILLDLSLPDSSGLETLYNITQAATSIPVVILSGSSDEGLALEAMNHGAQDYISKNNIDPHSLSRAIQYALLRSRATILEKSALIARQTELEALSELKSQFLANMSHEIRTPMNAVIAMTSLLKESSLDQEQVECVQTIQSSGEALLHIINEILDFSKIQSGKITLDRRDFGLDQLLNEIRSLFQTQATQKGLSFEIEKESELPPFFHGDFARIKQVLINLVGNSLKFTDKGSIILRVQALKPKEREIANTEEVNLSFEVEDSGIGIREEDSGKLFEVFNQANLTATKKYGGTGLGLAISKKIVELMQGRIGFSSAYGKGSVFYFEIKLPKGKRPLTLICNTAYPAQTKRSEAKEAHSKFSPDLKVLVAEDNLVNQRVVKRLLAKLGLDCTIVSSGTEAVKEASTGDYCAVLMDCSMPEMDGWEATKHIRKQGIEVPIVAMTANAFQEDKKKCLASGMTAYLAKPVTLESIENALLKTIAKPLEVLNLEKLWSQNAIGEDDHEFIKEILDLFSETASCACRELMEILRSDNGPSIKSKAHRLKGMALNIGAESLASVCESIENSSKNSQIIDAQKKRMEIEIEWNKLKEAIRTQRNTELTRHPERRSSRGGR